MKISGKKIAFYGLMSLIFIFGFIYPKPLKEIGYLLSERQFVMGGYRIRIKGDYYSFLYIENNYAKLVGMIPMPWYDPGPNNSDVLTIWHRNIDSDTHYLQFYLDERTIIPDVSKVACVNIGEVEFYRCKFMDNGVVWLQKDNLLVAYQNLEPNEVLTIARKK